MEWNAAIARAIVGAIPMTAAWHLLAGNLNNRAQYSPNGTITVCMDFVLGARAYHLHPRRPAVTSAAAVMDGSSGDYGFVFFSIDPAAWLRMNFGRG
jgi:hypothetical protein